MDAPINFEEHIGKVVGRRNRAPNTLDVRNSTIKDAIAWREAFGGVAPKGVYRFHTHEEADEWLWEMITRPRAS
jgi:hypothetical protein